MDIDHSPRLTMPTLSPLNLPFPLPKVDINNPLVCGMCSTLPDICDDCASVPQLARRTSPIRTNTPRPEIPEDKNFKAKCATFHAADALDRANECCVNSIQASMVAQTVNNFHVPVNRALSIVSQYIRDNLLIDEESEKDSSIDSWHEKVPDEQWDNSTTAATTSSDPSMPPSTPSDSPDTDMHTAAEVLMMFGTPPAPPMSDISDEEDNSDDDYYRGEPVRKLAPNQIHPNGCQYPDGFSTNPDDIVDSRWIYNVPGSSHHHAFLLPNKYGRLEDATFVRYDLKPSFPQVQGTHGKNMPIFSRLLRPIPTKTDRQPGPYSPLQRHLFSAEEPFLKWVEEAMDNIEDPTLKARVWQYCHCLKTAKATQESIIRLTGQLKTHMGHIQEALTDLQFADAFNRIVEEIKWQEEPNDPSISRAFDPIAATYRRYHPQPPVQVLRSIAVTRTPASCYRTPAAAIKKHCKLRCSRCRLMGHIKKHCPTRA
jgi:hypothetical protein